MPDCPGLLNLATISGYYAQLTGVLAGFAFTAPRRTTRRVGAVRPVPLDQPIGGRHLLTGPIGLAQPTTQPRHSTRDRQHSPA